MSTIDTIALSGLITNPDNPRQISEKQFSELVKSLRRDFKFLEKMQITVDDGMLTWAGNQRTRALAVLLDEPKFRKAVEKHYNIKLAPGHIPACWVTDISDYTDDEKARFALISNSPPGLSGDMDFDILYNSEAFDIPELMEWGLGPVEFEGNETDADGKAYGEETGDGVVKCTCTKCGHVHAAKD